MWHLDGLSGKKVRSLPPSLPRKFAPSLRSPGNKLCRRNAPGVSLGCPGPLGVLKVCAIKEVCDHLRPLVGPLAMCCCVCAETMCAYDRQWATDTLSQKMAWPNIAGDDWQVGRCCSKAWSRGSSGLAKDELFKHKLRLLDPK